MKNIKNNFGTILILIALVAGACSASKNPVREEKMRSVVESKDFIFRPDAILPLPSSARRLDLTTGRFSVSVINGTLTADLPFIGETTAPTIGRDELNIKFTTTDFTYETKATKKNRWMVRIRPQGQQHVSEMIFDIFDNGSATLKVNSNTRQSISFSGYVTTN